MIRPNTNKKRLSNHKTKKTKPANHLTTQSTRKECERLFTSNIFESKDLFPEKDTLQKRKSDIVLLQNKKAATSIDQENSSVKNSGPRYTFSTEIPEKYDDFYLCALPRDPEWLYVYWEFPDNTKVPSEKLLSFKSEIAQWILRVKTISSDSKNADEKHYDVPVSITDTNWYVKIPNPGYNCNVEYGYLTKEGLFAAISSTSPFATPLPAVESKLSGDTVEQTKSIRSANKAVIEKLLFSHDRSKSIPPDRSTKSFFDINNQAKIPSLKHIFSEEKRYFGSAAIH